MKVHFQLFLAVLSLLYASVSLAESPLAGRVKSLSGQVELERSGTRQAVSLGMEVRSADTLHTGPQGQVGLTLLDNTVLTAGPSSSLELRHFSFEPRLGTGSIDAYLGRGTLAAISGDIARFSPDQVRFSTPAMTLGVRGTRFIIEAGVH